MINNDTPGSRNPYRGQLTYCIGICGHLIMSGGPGNGTNTDTVTLDLEKSIEVVKF